MKLHIKPSLVSGRIKAPASKSYLQRAIVASMLADGESWLYNTTLCNDTQAVIEMVQTLGAQVSLTENSIHIKGGFHATSTPLNCHESGLALRMLSPIISLLPHETTITGTGSLLNRPIDMITQALTDLNVDVVAPHQKLPLVILGNLMGGNIHIDGTKGSQLLSGLLMALPLAKQNSRVCVNNLKSKPYVDMTIEVLQKYGIVIANNHYKEFIIPGNQHYSTSNFTIEGDWSSSAFLLVAAAIAGEVTIEGLNAKSKQADVKIIDVLEAVGAYVQISEKEITVRKGLLNGFEFDAENCPDLFPPLVALAAYCDSSSTIHGVDRLYTKESNRALTLVEEFAKMGVEITINQNNMIIKPAEIKYNTVNSHNDHRIAMAVAVAALGAEQGVEIDDFESINKSYPDFLKDLHKITQKQ